MTASDADPISTEPSLWAIWRRAKKLRPKWFNRIVVVGATACVAAGTFGSNQPVPVFAEAVRGWANLGFSFGATILGFLVAGFTVFATLMKPELQVDMARTRDPHSGLSYLKYSFFAFFEVFGDYIGFLFACLSILLLGSKGGPATTMIDWFPTTYVPTIRVLVVKLLAVVLAGWFFLVLMSLKSFIYNMYSAIMMMVVWQIEFGSTTASNAKDEASRAGSSAQS